MTGRRDPKIELHFVLTQALEIVMQGGQYLLPEEVAIIAALVLAPAIALTLAVQWLFFRRIQRKRAIHASRRALAHAATVLGTTFVVLTVFILEPSALRFASQIREIPLGQLHLPVSPLALLAGLAVGMAAALWAVRDESTA